MKEECFDLDLYTWTKINYSDEVITPRAELTHVMQLHVPGAPCGGQQRVKGKDCLLQGPLARMLIVLCRQPRSASERC